MGRKIQQYEGNGLFLPEKGAFQVVGSWCKLIVCWDIVAGTLCIRKLNYQMRCDLSPKRGISVLCCGGKRSCIVSEHFAASAPKFT